MLSNPAVKKGMCKDYKVTFKTSIYQVPGNECICIKHTWELHTPFSLSVYQVLGLFASLVELKALGVQSPYALKKIRYMVVHLPLTSIEKSWNGVVY